MLANKRDDFGTVLRTAMLENMLCNIVAILIGDKIICTSMKLVQYLRSTWLHAVVK